MNRALVVSLAGLVALSGCETASLTSQYAFPEEGRAYHYGNFCGPGVPERVSEDSALQLEVLNTLVPVDGIDAICRAHDVCYETHGRDHPGCDYAMVGALSYFSEASVPEGLFAMTSDEEDACINLAHEIQTPFHTKFAFGRGLENRARLERTDAETEAYERLQAQNNTDTILAFFGNDDAQRALDERLDTRSIGEVSGLRNSLETAAFTALSRMLTGFPDTPGTCNAVPVQALQSSFTCHFDHFEERMVSSRGDLEAVNLERMSMNGCNTVKRITP
ncbi:hypothetical protein [Oceanicaulis sp. HTCC2633]|uniref:hypothetical protein n=1 Tax=Oceanicaulis sp. HTCC2633 TaxID=314254 RepID=UPI000325315A|nr:hypothetical protein [Oceanicaulis sp. HTCC2633]